MKAKVAVLVPAYNEEDSIRNTIESLMRQTYPAHQIIVISDNSTDKTVKILEELVACYGHMGLTFFESVENKYKKGGALNQGFQKLDTEVDLVLTLDGDTILDANFLESGVEELASTSALGGVCARFRLNPFTGSNIFQHLLPLREALTVRTYATSLNTHFKQPIQPQSLAYVYFGPGHQQMTMC